MNIEIGKKYLHTGTGRIVKVVGKTGHMFSVIGNTDNDSFSPAFGSQLEPICRDEPAHVSSAEDKLVAPGHQTLLGSFVESWVNIVIGFAINFTANLVILPAFGFTGLTLGKNFMIGLVYTVISLVRSFVIRRYFNGLKWGNK